MNPSKGSIMQNIRWLVIANGIAKPLWFVFLLVSTRILGPEEFGRYMVAVSLVTIVAVFLEGGIDIHAVRTLASRPAVFQEFFGHTSAVKLLANVAVIPITLLISTFVLPQDPWLLIAAGVYNLALTVMNHVRFAFRAFEVVKYEAFSMFIEKACVVVFCGLVLLLAPGAIAYGAGMAVAYAIALGATIAIMVKVLGFPAWNIRWSYVWHDVIKPALPFALMNVFMIVYLRSGTLMLNALLKSDEAVGYYNAGYRLVEAFVLIPSMIIGPMYPVLARRMDEKPVIGGMVQNATRIILSVAILISLPMSVLHHSFTLLFYGPQYERASVTVGIICLAMIPVGLNWVYGTLVAAVGRQSKANIYILCMTVLNLCLHLLLIPRFGPAGAAVTAVITECGVVGSNWWLVRDYVSPKAMAGLLLRVLLPSLILAGLFFSLLSAGPFVVQLVLMIAGILAGLFLMRVVTIQDLRRLISGV